MMPVHQRRCCMHQCESLKYVLQGMHVGHADKKAKARLKCNVQHSAHQELFLQHSTVQLSPYDPFFVANVPGPKPES